MFSIGEFSKLTGLTIKTLRYYHEQGLLQPTHVDAGSGYRHYAPCLVETARCITRLRELGFSIAEIKVILREHDKGSTMLDFLQSRRAAIQAKLDDDRKMLRLLDSIIAIEQVATERSCANEIEIVEDTIDPILIASLRYTGPYEECGKLFGRIARRFGRHLCGKPMLLCHDEDFREEANYEVAFPIRKGKSVDDIQVYELVGGRTLSLIHRGKYQDIWRGYERLIRAAKDANLKYTLPTHEIYHKGPGLLFKGNPEKYLTKIRLMIEEDRR